jgi:integrating conjugative element protein (TIGR03761 family)
MSAKTAEHPSDGKRQRPTRDQRTAAERVALGAAVDALVDPLAQGSLIQFATEPNSPFPDGYSISGERAALAELGVTDWPDEGHPAFARYALLDERIKQLAQMQAAYKSRNGADPLVTAAEASSMRQLGTLVSDGADQMTLHTKEAYRLFVGRVADPERKLESIPGAKRLAHALRALWQLTAMDNPYADWALVRHDHNVGEVLKQLDNRTRAHQQSLDRFRMKGLNYSVLQSAQPKVLDLGFKSPYGYAVAELVVTYDYFVRIMKTLCRKNLISDREEYDEIREVTRQIRRHMHETAYFARWLTTKELIALSRADFLPGAPEEARKRQEAAAGIFGPVPSQVYSGALAPRHTKRRQKLTEAEQKLLSQVSAELRAIEAQEAEMARIGDAAASSLV